jgi:ATP phosphoribosyltransferase regulatory subunit HisZ
VARRERSAARSGGTALLELVERGRPDDAGALGRSGGAALEALEALREEIVRAEPALAVGVDLAEFADFSSLGGFGDAAGAPRDLRSYYGGLVMRGYLPGVARAVASGGRYDELFRRIGGSRAADGGENIAAVGFSLRLDPLAARADDGGLP